MLWLNLSLFLAIGLYFALLLILVFILSPKRRRYLKNKNGYEDNLHILVMSRQILLFFLPLMLSVTFLGAVFTLEQLLPLLVLGLTINIFWIIQLPLLTKAQLFIDFSVGDLDHFNSNLLLKPSNERLIYTRIYNMGFSTLKNATVLIYFGNDFEIIPCTDAKYKGLDFEKKFTIQKQHSGAIFTPKDNFQTLVPQEWFLFPVIIKTPKELLDNSKFTIQFYSENSWGLTKYIATIKTK
jgi:hypothetical protein